MHRIAFRCFGMLTACLLLAATYANAVEVQWGFNSSALTPDFNDHTTSMVFLPGTEAQVQFGTASSFGLPAVPGGDATAMQFPAFDGASGLSLYKLGPANGGGAYINQYTMVWDILIPSVTAGWFSFYNTNSLNTNDGDFFVRPDLGNGIGISGQYDGSLSDNTWYRIAVTLDAPTSTFKKFVNGTLVAAQTLGEGLDGRWTLYTDDEAFVPPESDMFLLTDNDGDTNAGYISAFYYTDKVLTEAEVAAMGGVDADGPGPVAPALMPDLNMDGVVDIFDVNIVSDNWGGPGPAGDANKDGIVDIFDVNVISDNWTTGVAPVPEPATVVLFVLGLVSAGVVRRGSKHAVR